MIEDEELLKTYNDIWNKVSNNMKKEFGSEPIYNKKFLKTKTISYGDETADFHEMPKVDSNYTYWTVMFSDFVLKKMKTIIHKCFLKKCVYIEKEDILIKIG